MLVRYRYRIDPTAAQHQALARAFGCARVVYNDAVAERRRAYEAGERLSDTEVQRRVITQAKRTPERAWLTEVASVALVQACQDARRAYRNWFDSLTGNRKGRRVGRPRFRTKHGRQSIRLTRNGFAVHGTRLYVAKVGELRVRWSRELPSVPSSVTVLREPDGRFYASFVVERDLTPLPPVERTAGIDLGLMWFATVAASDGTVEQVVNPQHLRAVGGAWRRRTAVCRVSGRGRPTAPRPAIGFRPRTGRFATGGSITTTSSPFGWSARTKWLPSRTCAWPGLDVPGWPGASTMLDGQPSSGCWRRRPPSTGVGSSRSAAGSPLLRPVRRAGTGTAPSRSTSGPGSARPAGSFTTGTSMRPAISWSPPGWRRPKTPVEPMSDRQR